MEKNALVKVENPVLSSEVVEGTVFEALDLEKQKKILGIQTGIESILLNFKTDLYELGKFLCRAKEILPHGAFQQWVEETFGRELPYSTAALCKGIYETFAGQPQAVRLLPLTFLMKVKQKNFPNEIRKLVMENPEVFDQTARELVEGTYVKFKEGQIDISGFEKLAKKQIAIGERLLQGETYVRNSRRARQTIGVGFGSLKALIQKLAPLVIKLLDHFPSAEKAEVDEYLASDSVLREIDEAVDVLLKLRKKVEGHGVLLKKRLVVKDGVVEKGWV